MVLVGRVDQHVPKGQDGSKPRQEIYRKLAVSAAVAVGSLYWITQLVGR